MSETKQRVVAILNQIGFVNARKISDALQGSVYRANSKRNPRKSFIIKVAKKSLHKNGEAIVDGKRYDVQEDIVLESSILKYLSEFEDCPKSIVKFQQFESLTENYCLVEEDGGSSSLFDFVVKAHAFLKNGQLDIVEWQNVTRLLFKQMVEAIDFIHSHNICHFDISLENFVINDVQIEITPNDKIRFLTDTMQIKLCDFGLSEIFKKGQKECLSTKYVGKVNYKSPECAKQCGVFDAKKNDIWCLGVCAFMMAFGNAPFPAAEGSNDSFVYIIDGRLRELLKEWKLLCLCNDELVDLLQSILKYETDRISLVQMMRHSWFQS